MPPRSPFTSGPPPMIAQPDPIPPSGEKKVMDYSGMSRDEPEPSGSVKRAKVVDYGGESSPPSLSIRDSSPPSGRASLMPNRHSMSQSSFSYDSYRAGSPPRSRGRSRSRDRDSDYNRRDRDRSRERSGYRSRRRSRSRSRDRRRSRSGSRDRYRSRRSRSR